MTLIQRLILRTLIVAAIGLSFAAIRVIGQTPAPTPNPELKPGVKLLTDSNAKQALDFFKKAVKQNKTDGEAWYYLGIVYLQISDLKKASEAFKNALELRPDLAAPAHAGYAYALVLRNKLASASAEADKALSIDPKNIEALYTLAIVELRKGSKDESVKKADEIIALKPDFAAAYLLKSQAFVSYSGGVLYPNRDLSTEERQRGYKTAAEALEKYLQLEADPVAAQPWQEQLESLRFVLADKSVRSEIYTGKNVTEKARVLAKPEPSYTENARSQQIEGTVVIRCVFASDGRVTHLLIVEALPYGLTERAIAAAKKIKFVPATRDGKPVSMWMQLEYNFNLY